MTKSKVAVIKTKPEIVFRDIDWAMKAAGFDNALPQDKVTILKDNISWHSPFLSANTTPWQLEGTILTLKNSGYEKISSVYNNTVVTNAFKGQVLNKLSPIYKKYKIEEKDNFMPEDIQWVDYQPEARMRTLGRVYAEGIKILEYFMGKNIIHLPTVKTHIYTTTGAMKNAFGGLLNTKRHYTHSVIHETLVNFLAIQKEIHRGFLQ